MQVKSTVRLSFPRVRQLTGATARALELTGEALHEEVAQAQVVPRRDGELSEEAFFVEESESQNGKVTLVHSVPYARRLYYHPEYKFHTGPWKEEWVDEDEKKHYAKHDGNPNARGLWYEDWLPGGKYAAFATKSFKRFYKQLGGV